MEYSKSGTSSGPADAGRAGLQIFSASAAADLFSCFFTNCSASNEIKKRLAFYGRPFLLYFRSEVIFQINQTGMILIMVFELAFIKQTELCMAAQKH